MRSSKPHEPLQILRSGKGFEIADPVTVGKMFQDTVKMFPKMTALCFKETGDIDWKEMSFTEYYSFTTLAARSLLKVYNNLSLVPRRLVHADCACAKLFVDFCKLSIYYRIPHCIGTRVSLYGRLPANHLIEQMF